MHDVVVKIDGKSTTKGTLIPELLGIYDKNSEYLRQFSIRRNASLYIEMQWTNKSSEERHEFYVLDNEDLNLAFKQFKAEYGKQFQAIDYHGHKPSKEDNIVRGWNSTTTKEILPVVIRMIQTLEKKKKNGSLAESSVDMFFHAFENAKTKAPRIGVKKISVGETRSKTQVRGHLLTEEELKIPLSELRAHKKINRIDWSKDWSKEEE